MQKLILIGLTLLFSTLGIFSQENLVKPDFPAAALAKFSGEEEIRVYIQTDPNGHAIDVDAFGPWLTCGKADPVADALRNAAIDAVRKSTFAQKIMNGQPVGRRFAATYTLDGDAIPPPPPPKVAPNEKVVNGTPLNHPEAAYPDKARKFNVQGSVTISVDLDEQGRPIQARAESGHPLLLDSAAHAACQELWTPTTVAGRPRKVTASITYNFAP